jgi:hypothetical protein
MANERIICCSLPVAKIVSSVLYSLRFGFANPLLRFRPVLTLKENFGD